MEALFLQWFIDHPISGLFKAAFAVVVADLCEPWGRYKRAHIDPGPNRVPSGGWIVIFVLALSYGFFLFLAAMSALSQIGLIGY